MKIRSLLSLSFVVLVPATAFPQALTSMASVRVRYSSQRNLVNPQGELKTRIDALDAQIAEAARWGKNGELRRLFAKGVTMLAGREWTDALEYSNSLVLRTEHVVADSGTPFLVRLEQIYLPAINLDRAPSAHATLRRRPVPAAGGAATAGEVVKDLGTYAGLGRDLRESPYGFRFDFHDVSDGSYQLSVEVSSNAAPLGTSVLNITLRKGLDGLVSRLENEAASAPADLRAEILFPVDRMRNVNRGILELRTFDPDKDFAAAEAVVAAVKAKKDPFAGRSGEFKRHYLLEAAAEVMPYHMYVPKNYDGSRAFPLIVALHGLGGTESSFFEGYDRKLPEMAEKHGYIVAAPLGYRVDGSYGWGLGNPPADVNVRRMQDLSEQDVMQVLQRVRQQYKIEDNRVYLMGHSMGGIGTWKVAAKFPEVWAAIAPFSGSGQPATIERFRSIPEIVIHGDNDPTVNVSGSRTMVAKMKELGVDVKYIEVPGGNHGSVVGPNIGAALDFFDAHRKNAPVTSASR